MVKNFISEIKKLKSKLKKYEDKLSKSKDIDKVLNNELKIDIYKEKINKLISKNIFNDKNKLSEFETKLNKISNGVVLPSKVFSQSKNVVRVVLKKSAFTKFDKAYTKDDVKRVGLKISKQLKDYGLNGSITTTLNFNGMVRSGFNSPIGSKINIHDPNDYYDEDATHIKDYDNINNFDNVIFWVTIDNPNAEFGGNSSFNDCFWFCINNGIPQYNPWKKPEELKEFLGLRRRDLIGLKDIEKIEKKIGKVGINVSGDCYYISKISQTKNLNLVLKNNHYQINHGLNRKVKFTSYSDKTILLYDKMNKTGFDGLNTIIINDSFYDDILYFKTDYILVERNNFALTVEEEYSNYIKLADELKLKSNGIVNIYKTGTIKIIG